jgi:uncharacterized protein (DUF1501 family)
MGRARKGTLSRRGLLKSAATVGLAAAFPHVWIPNAAYAQTVARGAVKHLLYIRLAGGFRFTCAYNGDTAAEFNPFGSSTARAPGTEWGVSSLLDRQPWLDGQANAGRLTLGMQRVSAFSNALCVLPCVDHEPLSARADGNHGSGLERFLTGYVGGTTSFLTFVNYGLRAQVAAAAAAGKILLPAFSLGEAGMSLGAGEYAAYRPPVLDGDSFDRFGFDADGKLPNWATTLANGQDERFRMRLHPTLRTHVESYQQSRIATKEYGRIFNDELLKIGEDSADVVDGISNRELTTIFGEEGTGRRVALALRLFHFGCPAVFMNQGGYDLHSNEEGNLPTELDEINLILSGLRVALKKMLHPEGGTYWDKTLVVLGSEFGRTTGGNRFNSARGSDHGNDLATRWMSMPMMGGVIDAFQKGGKRLGESRSSDLKATGKVYSYRGLMKTFLDVLGADHASVFPQDSLVTDLFA